MNNNSTGGKNWNNTPNRNGAEKGKENSLNPNSARTDNFGYKGGKGRDPPSSNNRSMSGQVSTEGGMSQSSSSSSSANPTSGFQSQK